MGGEMTAIIAFFFFFWVPIPNVQPNLTNAPPACIHAMARYHTAVNQFNAENAAKVVQLLGRSPEQGAVELPGECPQAAKLYRWKLQRIRALLPAWKALFTECAAAGYTVRLNGAATPPRMIAFMQQKLAEGCH
jgi:hypothetical protein